MENTTIRTLLSLFLREYGPVLNAPFLADWNGKNWAVATDAHKMILVPSEMAPWVGEVEKSPAIKDIIPAPSISLPLSLGALTEGIKSTKQIQVRDYRECDDCDGDGQFSHGNHEYECKECRGSGKIYSGKMVNAENPDTYFTIFGKNFGIEIFRPVFKACYIVGKGLIWVDGRSEGNVGSLFEIDGTGIYVYMMPCMLSDETREDADVIEIPRQPLPQPPKGE